MAEQLRGRYWRISSRVGVRFDSVQYRGNFSYFVWGLKDLQSASTWCLTGPNGEQLTHFFGRRRDHVNEFITHLKQTSKQHLQPYQAYTILLQGLPVFLLCFCGSTQYISFYATIYWASPDRSKNFKPHVYNRSQRKAFNVSIECLKSVFIEASQQAVTYALKTQGNQSVRRQYKRKRPTIRYALLSITNAGQFQAYRSADYQSASNLAARQNRNPNIARSPYKEFYHR